MKWIPVLITFYLQFSDSGNDKPNNPRHNICTRTGCRSKKATSLRFFILGDWGGFKYWPFYTPIQTKVAKMMAKVGRVKKTHFQLSMGDNMYFLGVKSVHDPRFKKTFEKVYRYRELYTPWYILAGNHDHYGSVRAQIDYSLRSHRWVFPDYYYNIRYRLANGLRIEIIMLDTIILCGNTKEGRLKNLVEYYKAPSRDRILEKPKDPIKADKQWEWLKKKLANSRAHYLFVAGHYPIYSIAEHGPIPCLVNRLRPLLFKYKVNAYFSGHDHSMQHLKETEKGWRVHLVLSGTGAFEIKSNKSSHLVPSGSSVFSHPTSPHWRDVAAKLGTGHGGFVYADVGKTKAQFTYFDGKLKRLHKFSLSPRLPVQ